MGQNECVLIISKLIHDISEGLSRVGEEMKLLQAGAWQASVQKLWRVNKLAHVPLLFCTLLHHLAIS